jgi:polar amino acid transport system permease protein
MAEMTTRASHAAQDPSGKVVVPRRRPWRWVGVAFVLLVAAMALHGLVTNQAFGWRTVFLYLFTRPIMAGLGMTLLLTVIAMAGGLLIGTVLAVMRDADSRLLSGASLAYTWFFRTVPVLVQLLFWFNFGALYKHVALGVPFGPELLSFDTNSLVSPFSAAVFGLMLSQGAYTGEIIRAGIHGVEPGQTRAALAIGMTRWQVFRVVVFPQALRIIIPALGNEVISMVKNTAMVSVLALSDLLYSAQLIYSRNYQTIPLLIVATIWYLVVVTLLTVLQSRLEKKFGRR